jgi:hypothetical protein
MAGELGEIGEQAGAPEEPTPAIEEAPTPALQEAHAPELEGAPAPEPEEAPAPGPEEAPTPAPNDEPAPSPVPAPKPEQKEQEASWRSSMRAARAKKAAEEAAKNDRSTIVFWNCGQRKGTHMCVEGFYGEISDSNCGIILEDCRVSSVTGSRNEIHLKGTGASIGSFGTVAVSGNWNTIKDNVGNTGNYVIGKVTGESNTFRVDVFGDGIDEVWPKYINLNCLGEERVFRLIVFSG